MNKSSLSHERPCWWDQCKGYFSMFPLSRMDSRTTSRASCVPLFFAMLLFTSLGNNNYSNAGEQVLQKVELVWVNDTRSCQLIWVNDIHSCRGKFGREWELGRSGRAFGVSQERRDELRGRAVVRAVRFWFIPAIKYQVFVWCNHIARVDGGAQLCFDQVDLHFLVSIIKVYWYFDWLCNQCNHTVTCDSKHTVPYNCSWTLAPSADSEYKRLALSHLGNSPIVANI